MAARGAVRYPAGADRKLLKSAHARTIKELETRFAATHKTFLRHSELTARTLDKSMALLDVDRDQVKRAVGKQFASNFAYVRKTRPPPKRPVRGHNPARYAPYDFSWSGKNCGGIAICSTYGPNQATGEVGLDFHLIEAGEGKGASGGAYVGDWFFSPSEDTWGMWVAANVWGRAAVGAAFGYANAYAGLQVFVRDDSTDETFVATSDIYNNSVHGFGFDIKNVDDLYVTAGLSIPVHANTWYEVWGGAVQHAYASGAVAGATSRFDMFIGPIFAGEIVIF
jgi:hypothetical protein